MRSLLTSMATVLLLLAEQGAGIRVEGQLTEEMQQSEAAAGASGHEESQRGEGVFAFDHHMDKKAADHQAAAAEEHREARAEVEVVMAEAAKPKASTPQAAKATNANEDCLEAIPEATVRKFERMFRKKKCQCSKGLDVVCPGEACSKYGRYFEAATITDRGCSCQECVSNCEAVEGGKKRKNGWLHALGSECECQEENYIVKGVAEACGAKTSRYYKAKDVAGLNCVCRENTTDSTTAEEQTTSTTTSIPNSAPRGDLTAAAFVSALAIVLLRSSI